mgnify:FL=1
MKYLKHFFKDTDPFTLVLRIAAVLTTVATLVLLTVGICRVNAPVGEYLPDGEMTFVRASTVGGEEEEYDDTETRCAVAYVSEDGEIEMTVIYTYEEFEALDDTPITGYLYRETDGDRVLAFPAPAGDAEIAAAVHDLYADDALTVFGIALSVGLLAIGLWVMGIFRKFFSLYETIWFLSILVLASVFSVIFPEDSCNGINGIVIMALYLADTFLNILCELLISKQSKWNFIVSIFVEITEILICVLLAYRFATMATTLLFWLPCDIISFINWNRKPDKQNDEITKVRTLKGWQEVLIILGIIVWTIGIGYLLSGLDLATDLFGGNRTLAVIVCYIDACVSAVGVVNGLAILFRLREQWIAWYISAIGEAVINILSGQFVLLILKIGYLTNTTYGYIQWTKYIKAHPEAVEERSFF